MLFMQKIQRFLHFLDLYLICKEIDSFLLAQLLTNKLHKNVTLE